MESTDRLRGLWEAFHVATGYLSWPITRRVLAWCTIARLIMSSGTTQSGRISVLSFDRGILRRFICAMKGWITHLNPLVPRKARCFLLHRNAASHLAHSLALRFALERIKMAVCSGRVSNPGCRMTSSPCLSMYSKIWEIGDKKLHGYVPILRKRAERGYGF